MRRGGSPNGHEMNPIDSLFTRLKAERRAAFMPFVPAGDPDLAFTESLLPLLSKAGADMVEVGFPFSDPIADGLVIQASYTRALNAGLKLDAIFETLTRLTATGCGATGLLPASGWQTPAVAMASYSLIYRRGPAKFIDRALQAGLSGVVVPDLPGEEAEEFALLAREKDFKLVLLVTPTTTPLRAEKILRLCSGFVYVVSIVGITGARDRLPETLRTQLQNLRNMTDLPLCVGFGVSKAEQVRELSELADGVIVGSALVRCLEDAASNRDLAQKRIVTLVQELSSQLTGQ